ncbi:ATPase, F1/V1/A1 complex, alpha/beta subunit [Tanacetum coccineum]
MGDKIVENMGYEDLRNLHKDGDNGVFGIGTNGMEYGVYSDADTKENCEMSQSKGTNACIPDNIADNLHKTNSNNESIRCGETWPKKIAWMMHMECAISNLRMRKDDILELTKPMLLNIPLEAWNVKGISALASRLGRPIKIDQIMSGDMCRVGSRRLGYARVLVEINAEDDFFDKIEINYVDDMKKVKSTKWVKVEYTWKPSRCSHCKVFGHSLQSCEKRPKPIVDTNIKANDSNKNEGANKEGFMEVKNMKNFNNNKRMGYNEPRGNKTQ